ncbi:uncharacterized protein LOC112553381 [Pomacea canaliculata]|uniref:uncharacterized protein LOC112553381 n=1 Tax=Pomacea canaliculata TaxID=400727 RepID=UPI000D727378|nr:uncharacterized protein LOC112553381 [Pomacea canaliculata]
MEILKSRGQTWHRNISRGGKQRFRHSELDSVLLPEKDTALLLKPLGTDVYRRWLLEVLVLWSSSSSSGPLGMSAACCVCIRQHKLHHTIPEASVCVTDVTKGEAGIKFAVQQDFAEAYEAAQYDLRNKEGGFCFNKLFRTCN